MNNVIKRVWNQNRMVAIEDLKGMTFQAESGGHTFQISGVDDAGNTVALTGSVTGVFLRPDNTDVAISGSASGGVASVTLPANCYDVPGRFGLTVFVTANGQKTAVYAAMGTVSRTSSGTVSPGTTADVVDLINQINAAVATIPASWTGLMADIAPTYSDAAVYPVGSYVYYNGDLYRCITAITTAESWTAGHWTQAVLGNDVSDLNLAITFIADPFVTFESGTFLDSDGVSPLARSNRIRNKDVLDIRNITSITIPTGFSAYIFLLNKSKTKLGTVGWIGGTIKIIDIITSETCYINFAIRKDDAASSDITSYIPTIQADTVFVSNTETMPWTVKNLSGEVSQNRKDIQKYARLTEDVTSEYTVSVGQAYGNVGSVITVDSSTSFKHIRIEKTDNVQRIRFNTAYYGTISSYVQYVDSNNRILSREYVQGSYEVSTVYEFYLDYPDGAVAVYVSCGKMTTGGGFILEALRNSDETINEAITEIRESVNDKEDKNYDRIITTVCRIAQGFNAPTQTIPAYQKAIEKGMRHLLCDVRFTSDGEIVLCHDNDIYTVAKNADGTSIPQNTVLISDSTLSELLEYDFGIGYSQAYAGTKILQLTELLGLCRKYGCVVHLELKTWVDATRCAKLFKQLTDYGMRDQAIFDIQGENQATRLKEYTPYFKLGCHTNLVEGHSSDIVLSLINECIDCLNDYNRNEFYISVGSDGVMGEQTAALMIQHDIKLMGATFNNAEQLNTYIARGLPYSQMRYALTNNGVIAGKIVEET